MSPEPGRVKALLITVNYKGAEPALRFLESLCKLKRFSELDVILVDNASSVDTVSRIHASVNRLENVRLLESATNRGYFGAAKWAMACYLAEKKAFPDWVIICNNDIIVNDERFLETLFERDPSTVGIVAPRIESLLTHLDQNPFMQKQLGKVGLVRIRLWFSSYYLLRVKTVLSPYIRVLRDRLRRLTLGAKSTAHPNAAKRIYAPHGAFLIFSRRYFECGGYIDDGAFLYAEELSVAEICRTLRLVVLHDPALHVLHAEHHSAGAALTRRQYALRKEGLQYLSSKYFATS